MTPAPPPRMVAAVALGGALGALLRWALGQLVPDGSGFPWTTFAINVSGSFALALLPALAAVRRSALLTVGLGTGVLGGYTTLSAYSEQARALLADGHAAMAAAYLLGTLVACLVAVALADRLSTAPERTSFDDADGDR
ncbi:CrcB family protein [Nocardioides sp. KIGAM211]|uniref:Fluoride-specific ion channel FluC n=1 Tax=Nocardioides luti TaxID=2761101 RepID=A0A7X0RHT6_9ACTN|nr:CrcB family protein [Nocardioides luti]